MIDEWAEECTVEYNEGLLLEVAGIMVENGKMIAPAEDEEVPEQE